LSSVPPDVHPAILRLSFSVVKGNLNIVLPGAGQSAPQGADATQVEGNAFGKSTGWQLKYSLRFAFEQAGFPLGQVSIRRTG